MKIIRSTPIVTILAGLAVSGCSSSSNSQPVPLDDLKDQLYDSQCAVLVRCHIVSDQEFCRAYFDAVLGSDGMAGIMKQVAAVNAGRTKYDGAMARTCLDAYRYAACDELDELGNGGPPACQKTFTGSSADGFDCTVDVECLSGSFCANRSGGALLACGGTGTCTKGGSLCNDDSHCRNGQVCDTSSSGEIAQGECVDAVPSGESGAPCGTRESCQKGLYCTASTNPPTCMPLAKEGEACDASGCVEGLLCVKSSTVVAKCMSASRKGEACLASSQCGGSALSSLVCDPATQRCVDAPTSGPCAADTLIGCNVLTSVCDTTTKTCQPIKPVGATCDVTKLECGLLGATCEPSDAEPQSGVCTARTSCPPA